MLVILLVVAVLGSLSFVGFVWYQVAYRGQTRSNPAFEGFHGQWDRRSDAGPPGEFWRFHIERDQRWSIREWTKEGGDRVVDEGTWTKIGERSYRLASPKGEKLAVISADDQWVMNIDGVKYLRVVK